jgi:hypothetical protein
MPYRLPVLLTALLLCPSLVAQSTWSWGHRLELRADYRWSDDERNPVAFPAGAVLETPDPGHHVELNVADVQFDGGYGDLFAVRAKVHVQATHRRNPTSTDRHVDADELFVRIGRKPEFLERPERTSFFIQAGKFPKMERQPVRLLESYGLAATSFNRFEDVQVLTGGTIGRSLYWRVQAANGNPLFFRDPNALAGDNGTDQELRGEAKDFGSGFPILYNAESEDLFLNTSHVQWGEALGYRWQREDQSAGFDVMLFHYQREMSDREELTGTRYGGDLDLLVVDEIPGVAPRGLPLDGRDKTESGARVYVEWAAATFVGQYTQQTIAGNDRYGWEVEAGYRIPLSLGPIESIQPAVRASAIRNDFGPVVGFPAPSIWWDWDKVDGGVRIGLQRGIDVTVEFTQHHVGSVRPLKLREGLVTLRWRV